MDKIEKLYFNSEAFNDPDNTFAFFKAGYEARKPDPWDMVPEELIHGAIDRRLVVTPDGQWGIITSTGTRDKVIHTIASGYNCDPARNNETRVYRDGEWINE